MKYKTNLVMHIKQTGLKTLRNRRKLSMAKNDKQMCANKDLTKLSEQL